MDSQLKRWPWLSKQDAELLKEWYEADPEAALEYRRHLDNERYSDKKYRQRTVSLEAITETGTVQFGRKNRGEYVPPRPLKHFVDFFEAAA